MSRLGLCTLCSMHTASISMLQTLQKSQVGFLASSDGAVKKLHLKHERLTASLC